MSNEHINKEENYFEEVGLASEFKEAVNQSPVIKFDDETLKDKLLTFEDNDLVVLKSEINSPKKIVFVEKYDDYVDSF